jgi:hypothetical protein
MKSEDQIQKRSSSEAAPANVVISTGQRDFWNAMPNWMKTTVVTFASLAGISLVTYLIYLYTKMEADKKRAKKEHSKSFGDDKHATWAKLLKQGIDNDGWWGTDVPLIRHTMQQIPSKEDFKAVADSYKRLTRGHELVQDLTDDLTRQEYLEMMAIKDAKPAKSDGSEGKKIYDPKGWAKRINAAINYTWLGFMPGTDLDAIKAVFHEFPSRKAFYDTAKEYRKQFGVSIWTDLNGDLDMSWDWLAAMKKKPAN